MPLDEARPCGRVSDSRARTVLLVGVAAGPMVSGKMTYSEYSLLAVALLFVAAAAALFVSRPLSWARLGAALAILALLAGTWLALQDGSPLSAALIVAGLGLLIVNWRALPPPRSEERLNDRRVEIAALGVVVIAAAALRFVKLEDFPDFIHGEESVWTWMSGTFWFSDERPWPIHLFTQGVPVSFYLEWPFFKLFGLNFYSPRYEVATAGTLGVVALYFVTRSLAGKIEALVAALFLATAMVSLAGSRAAVVWGHPFFWTLFTLWVYVEALKRRSVLLGWVTGAALAAGCLTYHTFLPIVAVVGLHAVYATVMDVKASGGLERSAILSLAGLVVPVAVVWPRVSTYLDAQRGHTTSSPDSLTAVKLDSFASLYEYISVAGHNGRVLLGELFRDQRFADFVVTNVDGPVVLPGIMALALVGVAGLMSRARDRWASLILLWIAIPLTFSPVVLGQPLLRTYSSAYPAIYIAAAMGVIALVEIVTQASAADPYRRFVAVGSIAVVVTVSATGSLIYFQKISSPVDGHARKSFIDDVLGSVEYDTRIILPYATETDWFFTDRNALRFALAGKLGGFDGVDRRYRLTPHVDLLRALQEATSTDKQLIVLPSNSLPSEIKTEESDIEHAINHCYPAADWETKGLWRVAEISTRSGACRASGDIALRDVTNVPGRTTFRWVASVEAGPYDLTLERRPAGVEGYEMEDFPADGGWEADDRFATGFEGTGYMFDQLSATTATVPLRVEDTGRYAIWFRTLRRRADDTSWTVSVDDQTLGNLSPGSTQSLNAWKWERLGALNLASGQHALRLKRSGEGWAIFVDAVYLSRNQRFDPARDQHWVPASNLLGGSELRTDHTTSTFARALPPGRYRWKVSSLSRAVVDGLGRQVTSRWSEFAVP